MNVENNCDMTIALLGDWLKISHQFYFTTNEKQNQNIVRAIIPAF